MGRGNRTRHAPGLLAGPTPEASHLGFAPPDDLAPLIVRLSPRVTEEISWIGDNDLVDDTKIKGRRYLLVRACDAWRAAEVLHHANSILTEDERSASRDWTNRFGDLAASSCAKSATAGRSDGSTPPAEASPDGRPQRLGTTKRLSVGTRRRREMASVMPPGPRWT